jgi:hypothetical protein
MNSTMERGPQIARFVAGSAGSGLPR